MEYFYILYDEALQPIEYFAPENTSDIESVRLMAADYMKAHDMPVGTLEICHPVTFLPIQESIDILL